MNGLHNLTREQAECLTILGRGRTRKSPAELDVPAHVIDALVRRDLVQVRMDSIQITTRGMAEALRLSTPDGPAPRLRSPLRFVRARAYPRLSH